MQSVNQNLLDKAIGFFNPKAQLSRMRYRAAVGLFDEAGYITPMSAKRSMRGWNTSANTADYDTIPKLPIIRAASRDLFMNTPVATAALRRIKTNSIGFGLNLQSRVDRNILGFTGDAGNREADSWERRTEAEFGIWANSVECDISRGMWFQDLTGLAFLSMIMSGDVFIALVPIPRQGQTYDLRLQILEADYICNPQFGSDTNLCAGGVEVDENGAPVAYYIRKPSYSNLLLSIGASISDTWVRVLTYGQESGRRQVLHLFTKERPGTRRGVPILAPVIEELKQLTRLSKAELDAAVINAFFTVFVKSNGTNGPALGEGFIPSSVMLPAGSPGVSIKDSSDPRDEKIYELGSGNIVEMDANEEIQLADPKRPTALFEPFFLALTKQIGAAIEVPFEQLMLHFQSSYSAARGALQEAWKTYRNHRMFCTRYFCMPIYEEWMTEAIIKGRIKAPGFFDDPLIRAAWLGSSWAGPGQGQLDPLRETNAAALRIEKRLSNYDDEFTAINGADWTGAMSRLARENQLLKEHDLMPIVEGAQGIPPDQQIDEIEETNQKKLDNQGDQE